MGATPANAAVGPNPTPNTRPESLGRVEHDAVKAARSHLNQNAAAWGIDPDQFNPSTTIDSVAGMSIIRFTQSIKGIEVANSLLAVTVDKEGSLLSYTKSISDYSNSFEAAITEAQATEILRSKFAEMADTTIDQVVVSEIALVITDSTLVDNVPSGKYLAWRATTSILNNATSISMTYLSQDGREVLSSLPFVRGITADPLVCDLQVDIATPGYVLPPGVTMDSKSNRFLNISSTAQGAPLCGIDTFGFNTPNTEIGKQNIIRTWDYFKNVLGQDINEEKFLGNIAPGVNGDLTPRISAFVNVCATDDRGQYCPYENAFWVPWSSTECRSGACSGIYLGQGFDKADDVIAHELAHGVTFSLAFSSAMVDQSETAALSEAISDIFGEAMDQLDVQPGEAADPAWSIGEDAKAGGYRNMRKPKVLKIDYRWKPDDSHDNSGPVNRLAYLLANGGKVGKIEIKALGSNANSVTANDLCEAPGECLGTVRMSQLVFATTSNLTATANYFDFGREMNKACFSLLKAKAVGFTTSTCKSVQSALTVQGFTNASINLKKLAATTKKSKPLILSASMTAINGTKVSGQKLGLQILVGRKWVTKQTKNTNTSGKATFSIKLNSKREYRFRVVSFSNSGLYSITSSTAKTTVR
jgi:Zn-dependent metalloprotease